MTTEELHKILDDDSVKFSVDKLVDIIFELICDCTGEIARNCSSFDSLAIRNISFYSGEQNAFYIVLDLLEHLK